ncbi:MAG: cupin domain-containing protein [Burkholderiales bacterium]|nr:cupin domain-containing protein [Burkholderiales bacterium]
MHRAVSLAIAGTAIAAAAFGVGVAVGQQTPPSANQGVTVSAPTYLELSKEVDSVEGRQLRLRIVTIEPGGVVANHSHDGRPTVAHLVSGELTERRDGDWVKVHQPGDSWTEGKGVVHWAQNKGTVPTVVVAVDVFKP